MTEDLKRDLADLNHFYFQLLARTVNQHGVEEASVRFHLKPELCAQIGEMSLIQLHSLSRGGTTVFSPAPSNMIALQCLVSQILSGDRDERIQASRLAARLSSPLLQEF